MPVSLSNFTARRPTRAEINLHNLQHNFRVMRDLLGAEAAIMPALKANAYGHGAVECARALEEVGAKWFAVALPEEAMALRAAGISKPILTLGGFWAGQESLLVEQQITPVVYRRDLLEQLNRAAKAAGVTVDYHLKVDTGMGRLGVPFAELGDFLDAAKRFTNVRLDGLMTHCAAADETDGVTFTEHQLNDFDAATAMVRQHGFAPRWLHAANSAAAHAYPQARGNLVRLGGVLYGMWRDSTKQDIAPLDWRPVMAVRTEIVLVKTVADSTPLGYGGTFVTKRESRIATIAMGYEDGLRRGLSNRGRVLVRGEYAPIVGRVSMDLTLVDVTDIATATVGDEVVIIGGQGEREIPAEEIAAQLGTISYEVTCGISDRVPRVYMR